MCICGFILYNVASYLNSDSNDGPVHEPPPAFQYTCQAYKLRDTFAGPCSIVVHFCSKTNQMHNISNLFYFGIALYMFVGRVA